MRRLLLALALAALAGCGSEGRTPAVDEGAEGGPPGRSEVFRLQRERMVRAIEEEGVRDRRVLRALGEVERHRFVPRELRRSAYELKPLPIGDGQTISDPLIVGLMTELLELRGDETVLEIGTGSGYQAAVLARMVPRVFTIEIRPGLAESARRRLEELGYDRVEVRCGDGYLGWPEEAPFEAVIVTAAPPEVPAALVEQLAPGGRMVVPVGGRHENQILMRIRRDADGKVSEERIVPVRFVPMIRED